MDIEKEIEQSLKDIGLPEDAVPLDEEQTERFQRTLPPSVAGFFVRYGVANFFDGLFRMCDPAKFRSVLALVFRADHDFHHNDCQVIAYTAFGYLHAWSQKFGIVRVDLPAGRVFCQALAPTTFRGPPAAGQPIAPNDERMWPGIVPFERDDADYSDFQDKPMYRRCQKMHGRLQSHECYGFFPALAVAGVNGPSRKVENIKRVAALEHFAMLAQLDTFYLTRLGPGGFEPVRPIG